MRKVLVAVLVFSMIVSNIPAQTLMATEIASTEENAVVASESVESTEPTVTNVVYRTTQVFEGTGYTNTGYNPETGNYEEFTRYEYAPNCTVTFGDGTVVSSQSGWIHYNNNSYYTRQFCTDDQGVGNEWGIGDHEVTFSMFGYETTCVISVIENPIVSFVCEDLNVIEYTNGYYASDFDESGTEHQYYYYHASPKFTLTFSDGTVINQLGTFQYKGEEYYISYGADNQNYENQWTVGNTYTGTASVLGMSVTYNVNIVESPIESIICNPLEVMEFSNGNYEQAYDYKTGECVGEYFRYYLEPSFNVIFKDGTVMENQQHGIHYNGQWYQCEVYTEQSYENQWTKGNQYSATGKLMGKDFAFSVSIVGSPIKSFVCRDMEIIEGTNGNFQTEYNPETNSYEKYFCYWINMTFDVVMNDGTTYTNINGGFEYNGQMYSPSWFAMQSPANPWTAGNTYTVTANLLGAESSFDVTIVESPIASIEVDAIEMIEGSNQEYVQEIDPETGNWHSFYKYRCEIKHGTVIFTDGTTQEIHGSHVYYNGMHYQIQIMDDQSYSNTWGVGTHTATAHIMGASAEFNVTITETPYVALEILNVASLTENENCWMGEEHVMYNIPEFTFKLTLKDGSTEIGYYSSDMYMEGNIECYSSQYEEPWTVGGDNYFTVEYLGLEVQVPVEILPASEYEYIVEEGEVYIVNCKTFTETLEIPSEIDGMPVVGILSIGFAEETAKEIVIPDSVIYVSYEAFGTRNYNLQTIQIGSGVSELDFDTLNVCRSLQNVIVSEDNEYYASIDGVLYDKAIEALIYYPILKGNTYTVPATVTNIDILNYSYYNGITILFDENSIAFVTEDDVTYNADKTRIIRCNPSKTGEYIMPDTVEEIAYSAFQDCVNLTKITMSDSVKYIPDFAFMGCSALTEIEFSNTLETIGHGAFIDTKITELTLPDSLLEIGGDAFYGVPLRSVSFGSGLKAIGPWAFAETRMTTVTIPDNVEELGYGTFSYCEYLEEVTIGKGITIIADSAFESNYRLKQVTILSEDVVVDSWAFSYCEELQEFDFSKVNAIGSFAFCGTAITSAVIPEGVTSIAYGTFASCKDLVEIDLPESVVSVEAFAFDETKWYETQADGLVYLEQILYDYKGEMNEEADLALKEGTTVIAGMALSYCENATSIELPEGLISIGDSAFVSCSKMEEIYIPASVEEIGRLAFEGCDSLTAINVDAENPYYTSVDGVLFDKDCTELIWCPLKNVDTYTVPETVAYIWEYAFSNSDVEVITIPNSETELEWHCIGYGQWGERLNREVTIICEEDSLAYEYVVQNLMMKNGVESVAIETLPNQLTYEVGEEFNPDGMTLKVTHNNDMVSYVIKGFGAITFDSSEIGTETVTVNYSGQTVSFDVEIVEEAEVEKEQINGFDINISGPSEVKVGEEVTLELTIKNISGQVLTLDSFYDWYYQESDNSETYPGVKFGTIHDMNGIEITSKNVGTFQFDVDETQTYTITGTIPDTWNDKSEVLVVMIANGESVESFSQKAYTAALAQTEEPDEPDVEVTITETSFESLPNKLSYEIGEVFDFTGIALRVVYSDGTSEIVTDGFEVLYFDSSVAGIHHVTVVHKEYDASAAFEVIIKEPEVEEPEQKAATVILGNATAEAGEEVQVTLSFDKATVIKSLAISNIDYDTTRLELIGGEWNVDGILSDWGTVTEGAGALAFAKNTTVEGTFLTLTFKVLEDVEDVTMGISCHVIAKEMLDSGEELDYIITVIPGEVVVKNVIIGDVNGDGYVTSDDAIYLLYYTTDSVGYPINQDGDFDGNGYVTSDDAIYLLYHVMLPGQYPLNK